jgi:hypothetical protein
MASQDPHHCSPNLSSSLPATCWPGERVSDTRPRLLAELFKRQLPSHSYRWVQRSTPNTQSYFLICINLFTSIFYVPESCSGQKSIPACVSAHKGFSPSALEQCSLLSVASNCCTYPVAQKWSVLQDGDSELPEVPKCIPRRFCRTSQIRVEKRWIQFAWFVTQKRFEFLILKTDILKIILSDICKLQFWLHLVWWLYMKISKVKEFASAKT